VTDDFGTLAGMSETPNQANQPENNLASRLRKIRDDRGLSLDEVAAKAGISKTYLWELERDTDGVKKPSADVLLRIAKALSTTLAELLALATVKAPDGPVEIPPSLNEFRNGWGRSSQRRIFKNWLQQSSAEPNRKLSTSGTSFILF
jgi:transcriptional regulator with XRE-family HTH domain